MSAHHSSGSTVPGHGYNANDSTGAPWTAEQCFEVYQASNNQFWAENGLTMKHYSAPSYPSEAYVILPQQDYIANRRYERQPPIVFRASPSVGYVRLIDFHPSCTATSTPALEDGDDVVFMEENLSQKQSIRLQVNGCKPYEKQINVRNPMGKSRSITRRRLAEKLAKEIRDDFMIRMQTTVGDPSLGLGPGTNGFERLVLIELRHVSRSSWQPILGVLPRRN